MFGAQQVDAEQKKALKRTLTKNTVKKKLVSIVIIFNARLSSFSFYTLSCQVKNAQNYFLGL